MFNMLLALEPVPRTLLCSAAIVLALAGCGARLSDVRGQFAEAGPCCAAYGDLPYEPLDVESVQTVSVGPAERVFQFETGKSPFVAFRIPSSAEPLRLTVESYLQSSLQSPTTGDQYFFAPNVVLLDGEYKVLRTREPRHRRVRYVPVTEFLGTGGLGWKIVLGIDIEPDEGVRHVVVRTTAQLLGEATSIPAPRASAGVADIPHAPIGRLRVGLSRVASMLESLMLERKPAYALVAGIPPGKSGEITRILTAEQRASSSIHRWPAYRRELRALLDDVILRNDYPDVPLHTGLLELLESYPGTPFGITWNGGIAVTAGDFSRAEQLLERFRADPARYDRERPREREKDRLHPLNHLEPLLDW